VSTTACSRPSWVSFGEHRQRHEAAVDADVEKVEIRSDQLDVHVVAAAEEATNSAVPSSVVNLVDGDDGIERLAREHALQMLHSAAAARLVSGIRLRPPRRCARAMNPSIIANATVNDISDRNSRSHFPSTENARARCPA